MHPKGGGRGAGLASAHDAKSDGRPHAAFTRVPSGCAPVAPSQITHSLPRRATGEEGRVLIKAAPEHAPHCRFRRRNRRGDPTAFDRTPTKTRDGGFFHR